MTDKILSDKDCKTIRDAITNPNTFKDKHMEEVIKEFKAKFKHGDEHCKFSGADLLSHIPKACRMYARKVMFYKIFPIFDKMRTYIRMKYGGGCELLNEIQDYYEEIQTEIDRLTEEKPT